MVDPQRIADLAERRSAHLDALGGAMLGSDWCAGHTALVDEAVRLTFASVEDGGHIPAVAVIATGGYGRSELAPYSDVDLTVVPLDESDPEIDKFIKALYAALHDSVDTAFGLQLGYRYMLMADAPGLDAKSRTGLLDTRLVAGSNRAYNALGSAFWDSFPNGEFLLTKIEEREAAFARFGDTPLVVEPHLKEGAGGLRSFHCANWIGAAIGSRPRRPIPAYETVLAFRNAAHFTAGKASDLLTRQRQAAIADQYGEHILGELPKLAAAMCDLDEEYRLAVASLYESRYRVSPGVIALRGEARFLPSCTMSQAAAGVALATQLGLRVAEVPARVQPEIDGAEATFALTSGEATVRNLERSGLLDSLLPELAACKTLMPNDTAHAYTVYEHTLRAIRTLDSLEPNSFLGELKQGLRTVDGLYLALLLHDVGKACYDRPHSETGAEIAQAVAKRWNLSEGLSKLVVWLVRDHLLLSNFIRLRDIANPATAAELAAQVENAERLDCLTLLTWADVNAVAPGLWTPAQQALLEELWRRTRDVLESGGTVAADANEYRRRLLREVKEQETTQEEIQGFLDSLPAQYLVSTPPEAIQFHLTLAKRALQGDPSVALQDDNVTRMTEVTVCCLDEPALLSRILGVFYAFDLTVHGLRASTTTGDRPVAVDLFTISLGSRPVPPATAQKLVESLRAVLRHEASVEDLLVSNNKDPHRPQEVFTYKFLPGDLSILEVQAPRGRGMAYRFTRLIATHGWNITAARFGQWAGRGSAAFYLEGVTEKEMSAALAPHATTH